MNKVLLILTIVFGVCCLVDYIYTVLWSFDVLHTIDNCPIWKLIITPFLPLTIIGFYIYFLKCCFTFEYQIIYQDPSKKKIIGYLQYSGIGYYKSDADVKVAFGEKYTRSSNRISSIKDQNVVKVARGIYKVVEDEKHN